MSQRVRRIPHPDRDWTEDWGGVRVPPSLLGATLSGRWAPKPVVQLVIDERVGEAGTFYSLERNLSYATIVTTTQGAVEIENMKAATMNNNKT